MATRQVLPQKAAQRDFEREETRHEEIKIPWYTSCQDIAAPSATASTLEQTQALKTCRAGPASAVQKMDC